LIIENLTNSRIVTPGATVSLWRTGLDKKRRFQAENDKSGDDELGEVTI